jgi:lipoprotein NlpD
MFVLNKVLTKKMVAALLIGSTALLTACGTGGSGSGASSSRKADGNGMYRVKSGDTLVLIARANGVDYTDIMRWNNLTNPNRIEVGWRLRVRPNASSASTANTASTTRTDNTTASTSVSNTPDRDLGVNPNTSNNINWGWPTAGAVLVKYDGSNSKGLVFDGAAGDPVLSVADGQVTYAGNSLRGYGNMVVVKHSETWSTVYANNSALQVKVGDRVQKGQAVAKMGDTDAQRVQLYFETRLNAKPVDPLKVLPARAP